MLSAAVFTTNSVFAMNEDDIGKEAPKTAAKQKNEGSIFGCPRAFHGFQLRGFDLTDRTREAIASGVPVNISADILGELEIAAHSGEATAQITLAEFYLSKAKATRNKE